MDGWVPVFCNRGLGSPLTCSLASRLGSQQFPSFGPTKNPWGGHKFGQNVHVIRHMKASRNLYAAGSTRSYKIR